MAPGPILLALLSLAAGTLAAPFRPQGQHLQAAALNETECAQLEASGTAGYHHHACQHFRHHGIGNGNGTDSGVSGTGVTNMALMPTTTITEVITVAVTPSPVSSATPTEEALPTTSSTTSSSTSSSTPVQSTVTESNLTPVANVAENPQNYPSQSSTTYAIPTPAVTTPTPAAATTAASTGSGSSGSSSGSKKGIAFNDAAYIDAFPASDISYAYNWGSSYSGSIPSNIEFVPLLWCNSESLTSGWQANAQKYIDAGSTHLMSFNEPDLDSQCNIDPATAAAAYKTYISDMFGGKGIKLGAPAVTNGGGSMGLTWLQNFIEACSDCQIDFVALHWYNPASLASDFQSHVQQANQLTGKPVWVTEYGCTGSTDAEVESFLQTVNPWMDQQSYVERYSYFMATSGDGMLCDSTSELSAIGNAYMQAS